MGNVDTEAPPPSYNSIFGELKHQKSQSDGVVDYAKNATGICCGKVAGACCMALSLICAIAFGLALPVTEIVIGAMNLHNCPAQDYLPIFLIVSGVFSMVSLCTGSGQKMSNRGEDENEEGNKKGGLMGCCNSLVGGFLIAWLITGSVWVFKMRECSVGEDPFHPKYKCFTMNTTNHDSNYYCEELLYQFTFWETLAKWIVFGLILVVGCFSCCILCCAYCCGGNTESEE